MQGTRMQLQDGSDLSYARVTGKGAGWTRVQLANGREITIKGDAATRNNNPGNLVMGPRAKRFGAVGIDSNGFAVFPTRDDGLAAQRDWLSAKANKTILDAIKTYAPKDDGTKLNKGNNPTKYAKRIAAVAGVTINTKIGDLSPAQLDTLVSAMHSVEGNTRATVFDALTGENLGVIKGGGLAKQSDLPSTTDVTPTARPASSPASLAAALGGAADFMSGNMARVAKAAGSPGMPSSFPSRPEAVGSLAAARGAFLSQFAARPEMPGSLPATPFSSDFAARPSFPGSNMPTGSEAEALAAERQAGMYQPSGGTFPGRPSFEAPNSLTAEQQTQANEAATGMYGAGARGALGLKGLAAIGKALEKANLGKGALGIAQDRQNQRALATYERMAPTSEQDVMAHLTADMGQPPASTFASRPEVPGSFPAARPSSTFAARPEMPGSLPAARPEDVDVDMAALGKMAGSMVGPDAPRATEQPGYQKTVDPFSPPAGVADPFGNYAPGGVSAVKDKQQERLAPGTNIPGTDLAGPAVAYTPETQPAPPTAAEVALDTAAPAEAVKPTGFSLGLPDNLKMSPTQFDQALAGLNEFAVNQPTTVADLPVAEVPAYTPPAVAQPTYTPPQKIAEVARRVAQIAKPVEQPKKQSLFGQILGRLTADAPNPAGYNFGSGAAAIDSLLGGAGEAGATAYSKSDPNVSYKNLGNGVVAKYNKKYDTTEFTHTGLQAPKDRKGFFGLFSGFGGSSGSGKGAFGGAFSGGGGGGFGIGGAGSSRTGNAR
jgi:hypothetical protein